MGGSGDRHDDWFDEIDLDPASTWRRMGTRNLGDRPWLVADDRRQSELAIKARLLAERHTEVFLIEPEAEPGATRAGLATLALVEEALAGAVSAGGADGAGRADGAGGVVSDGAGGVVSDGAGGVVSDGGGGLHPLDQAGRSVQEDLCLLRRSPEGWVLAGASLCFPSRWRLADKLGRPMAEVHGPVDGYRSALASRVDRMFDRLAQPSGPDAADRIVWRRNWFIHPDPDLFQPDRPPAGDPFIEADHCLDELYLRSERQTLRRLAPDGWILFTVRTQQDPVAAFVADPGRRAGLIDWLIAAPATELGHRGLPPGQAEALALALGSGPVR